MSPRPHGGQTQHKLKANFKRLANTGGPRWPNVEAVEEEEAGALPRPRVARRLSRRPLLGRKLLQEKVRPVEASQESNKLGSQTREAWKGLRGAVWIAQSSCCSCAFSSPARLNLALTALPAAKRLTIERLLPYREVIAAVRVLELGHHASRLDEDRSANDRLGCGSLGVALVGLKHVMRVMVRTKFGWLIWLSSVDPAGLSFLSAANALGPSVFPAAGDADSDVAP